MKAGKFYADAKPVWGDREQINAVRIYDKIRNGLLPVTIISEPDPDDEFDYEIIVVECPCCFIHHTLYLSTDKHNKGDFELDSNYCVRCDTEFMVNPDSEFEILVVTTEHA
jgi:hypothetical protein